jgi:hypothetical protein
VDIGWDFLAQYSFTIRELANLWHLPRKRVCQILDEHPGVLFRVVLKGFGKDRFDSYRKGLVQHHDAVWLYESRVFHLLPPSDDALTPNEFALLVRVIGNSALDGRFYSRHAMRPVVPDLPFYWLNNLRKQFPNADRRRVLMALRRFRPDLSFDRGYRTTFSAKKKKRPRKSQAS